MAKSPAIYMSTLKAALTAKTGEYFAGFTSWEIVQSGFEFAPNANIGDPTLFTGDERSGLGGGLGEGPGE